MENRNQKKNIPINEGMHESNLRQSGQKQTTANDSIPMPPVKKKKKKKTSKVLIGVLIAFAVIILAVVGYAASVLFFYEPDTQGNTDLPFDVDTGLVTDENNNVIQQPQIEVDDKQFNFLVVARDKVSGLTDVMMVINYNITEQSLNVMQIPRDTYIEIEDYYYHKINGAYSYFLSGRRGEENAERAALRDVADMLEKNLCIKIHYTAQLDIDGFGNIVDAIGGVEMYVPQKMEYYDPAQGLSINLKEGYQTLDGERAEQFVRYRYGLANGDIGRGDMQKLFMTAFIKKVLSSITDVGVLTDLVTSVYDCISTDINLNDLIYFAKNFIGFGGSEKVDLENVNMFTLPGAGFYYDLSYYSLNKESVIEIINDRFNIYNYDITPSFDKNSAFVNEDSSDSVRVYNLPKDQLETEIYNGEQMDQSGLN